MMLSNGRIRYLAEVAMRPFGNVRGVEAAIRAAAIEAEAAVREAAAKLIEDEEGWEWAYHTGDDPPFPMGRISYSTRHNIAAAVRACGEEEQ